jgi:hypothetical protein
MPRKRERDTSARFKQAKAEAKTLMLACAGSGRTITYGDLAARIRAIHLVPNSSTLARLLTEISTQDFDATLGILSAVAVRKDTHIPGIGFFNVVTSIGRSASDPEVC